MEDNSVDKGTSVFFRPSNQEELYLAILLVFKPRQFFSCLYSL